MKPTEDHSPEVSRPRLAGLLTVDNAATYVLALIALAVLFVLLRPPMPTMTLDEAAWQTSVEKVLRGKVLMRDATMAKGPYLVAHHVAFTSLLGRNVIALHLMGSVWTLLTGLLVVWMAGRLAGRRGVLAAAFFWVVAMSHEGSLKGAQAEVLMILYVAAAMFALIVGLSTGRRWLFVVCGAGLMIGALIKQVVAFDMLAAFAAIVAVGALNRTRVSQMAAQLGLVGVGAIIGFLPVAVYVVYHSLYGEFMASFFGGAMGYAGRVGPLDALRNFAAAVVYTLSPMSGLYAAALAGIGMMVSSVRRWGQSGAGMSACRLAATAALVLVLWAVFALGGLSAPKRFGLQYFVQLAPVATLLAAWFVARCFASDRTEGGSLARQAAWGIVAFQVVLLLPPLMVGVGGWRQAPEKWTTPTAEQQVGLYLRERTGHDDTIFVWGDRLDILYWAEREMASDTPYGTFSAVLGMFHGGRAVGTPQVRDTMNWDWLRSTLGTFKPTYVVVSPVVVCADDVMKYEFDPADLPQLFEILELNYEYEAAMYDYRLYRRKAAGR